MLYITIHSVWNSLKKSDFAKVHWKCQNGQFGEFFGKQKLAVKKCYQTDQLLIRQMLMENAWKTK